MATKMEEAMKTMLRLGALTPLSLFLSHNTHTTFSLSLTNTHTISLSLDGHQDGGGHEDHAEARCWILGKLEILQGKQQFLTNIWIQYSSIIITYRAKKVITM